MMEEGCTDQIRPLIREYGLMTQDNTNPVRTSVVSATDELALVSINEAGLEDAAQKLATDEFDLPEWRAPVFPDEDETSVEDVTDFLFVGNTINFAFRNFETGEKFAAEYLDTDWAGAFGMWACLKRAYDNDVPVLSGEYLRDLTLKEAEELFAPSGPSIPMLEQRVAILNDVGETLCAKYDGRFSNLVERAEPRLYADGNGIVDRLVADFDSFDDTAQLNGETVHLYKRAQLAPAMAYGRFQGDEFRLDDPNQFTVFADYNLPNVLRHMDILEYDTQLARRIGAEELIPAGSREEVELRAATVAACDDLVERINARRDTPIYGPHMDAKLFMMRDEVETPVHKTRTVNY